MNDQSAPLAPAIGSLWLDFDGSPWPARFPPVRVTDVCAGWVRLVCTKEHSEYRLPLRTFTRFYRPIEASA